MTRKTAPMTGLVLALAALSGTAIAKSGDRAMGPGFEPGPRASFEELDTNGDGQLTQAEIENRRQARFAAVDTNGDGVLSTEEMQVAASARMAERMAQRIERLDTDGDSALSFAELEAGRAGFGERRGGSPERLFQRLDADGDGAISQAEFDARPMKRGHQ